MRAIFTVGGLLVVLAIVGVLAKQQLGAGVAPQAGVAGGNTPAATPQQQVQQFQKAAEAALQQPRPLPDDTK